MNKSIVFRLVSIALAFTWLLLATNPCAAQSRFARRAFSTSNTNVGYIDTAYVGDMLRFRFDAGYGNEVPDRAEFFYAKCGCFQDFGVDPHDAPGPPKLETNVDFQTIQADVQFAVADGLAVFAELPVRFINPDQNDNSAGLSDIQAGFKGALLDCEHKTITYQFRVYIPTGDADRGLGTSHASVEPALLYYQALTDRLTLEAELRDWIPLSGSSATGTPFVHEHHFTSNIVRYGVGLGYTIHETEHQRITPVVEFVGWTLLDGISSRSPDGMTPIVEETDGDTIFNVKAGLRVTDDAWGSLYVGYGRGLSSDVWYQDIFRLEYRMTY